MTGEPRGLSAEKAAAYCGISRNSLLRHGPPATKIGGRNVWDRRVLDLWLDRLAGLGPPQDGEGLLRKAIHARKDPLRHSTR